MGERGRRNQAGAALPKSPVPSHLARAAPRCPAPGIVLFSAERTRGAGTGYTGHSRARSPRSAVGPEAAGELCAAGRGSGKLARKGRRGGGRERRSRLREQPRRARGGEGGARGGGPGASRTSELVQTRATLLLCLGSAPAAGGAVAAAELRAPPPRGPRAPGASRTGPTTTTPASAPARAGRLRLRTAGPPSAARIIPCAELPLGG